MTNKRQYIRRVTHYTRRLKKHGGAETVFVCEDDRRDNKSCIEDFEAQLGFVYHDVPPDGNCFFHALELYYKLTYPMSNDNKSYMKLRKIVVDFINTHFNEYEPYGITKKDIIALSKNGGWNNIAGDFVIPAAAPALNLKIKLYDLKEGNQHRKEKKRIILYIYPEIENGIEREEVHLIRINDNHFGLLIPTYKPLYVSMPVINTGKNKFKELKEQLQKHINNTRKNSNKNKFKELKEQLQKHINNTRKNSNKNSNKNKFKELKDQIKVLKSTYVNTDPK